MFKKKYRVYVSEELFNIDHNLLESTYMSSKETYTLYGAIRRVFRESLNLVKVHKYTLMRRTKLWFRSVVRVVPDNMIYISIIKYDIKAD